MTEQVQTEKREFQTEVKQLLHLMIHSLYSNKEIFLRELISNASDASDKLSFLALQQPDLYEGDGDLRIWIETDSDAGTLTIRDNGIGMTRDEVVQNLGTIARSGTSEFLRQLSGDQKKDSRLIGQFGVGFYSAFIVADRVEVHTRKAGESPDRGVYWSSRGDGEFELGDWTGEHRGTRITLHLREEDRQFLSDWTLRELVRKYSDHVAIPVMMRKPAPPQQDEASRDETATPEWEQVNAATALWTRNRSEVKDEEYQEFYRHLTHDVADALTWSHNRVEGKLDYTSLLYVPSVAPFDLWQREAQRGLKLYVQRVFIMDDAEQFLPLYLRFVKGVVDTSDLSLNVSREILQNDRTVASLKSALTKRVLSMLEKLSEDAERYQTFWNAFGNVLKEGVAEDFAQRETLARLLRFASTHAGEATQSVSLSDYIGRMKDGQKGIYYLISDSHANALGSPHLEVFRKKGIEVLLLSDRIDEWVMSHLQDFQEKPLIDITKGDLDLGDLQDEDEKKHQEDVDQQFASLVEQIGKILADEVDSVRTTHRLTESPACLVVREHDMGTQMRRILEAAGQPVPSSKPILEINPDHPILQRLLQEASEELTKELVWVVYEQARLASGEPLKDTASYVRRINQLLQKITF